MKKLSPLFLLLALIPQLSTIASAQNDEAVVEKHLAALGGREALSKLTSRKSTGTVSLTTPGGPLSGPLEILVKSPNKSRLQMTLDLAAIGGPGTMTVEQRFDGTTAYATNSMQGETQIPAKQLDHLRNNVFPTPLIGYKDRGTRIEVLANEKVNGKDAIVLLVTPKSGPPTRMFLDAETYLMIRFVTTISSPQLGGDLEQTTDLSDYRVVDGVKVPFRAVAANSMQTVTFAFDKIEHNIAIDDAMFAKK
jgi:outer membrane lipoprotein-sorting protein